MQNTITDIFWLEWLLYVSYSILSIQAKKSQRYFCILWTVQSLELFIVVSNVIY